MSDTSPGFRARIVGVVGFIPNTPTHRRDTILCKLDCGHVRSVLSINHGESFAGDQYERLVDTEVDCAKCAVLDRIRQKARSRIGSRRRVPAWVVPASGSRAVG